MSKRRVLHMPFGTGSVGIKAENVFASPWNYSDVVLVVEETEFHVHRSILMLQSPVFKAMLDGHFKETSQKKITLEGKTSEDMLQFLKLFYPHNMIKEPLISLSGENVFKMLVLADEYQAEGVINQCLEEVKITAENAFRVFPYASKYNQFVRAKCVGVIKSVSIKKAKEELSKLDNEVVKELLLTKCRFLESVVLKGNKIIIALFEELLDKQNNPTTASGSAPCSHTVSVRDFRQARQCEHCLKSYKESFADKFVYHKTTRSCFGLERMEVDGGKELVALLKDMDDITKSATTL